MSHEDDVQKVIEIDDVESVEFEHGKATIILKSRDAQYKSWFKKYGDRPKGQGWVNKTEHTLRMERAFNEIKDVINPSILDVGCGSGLFFDYIKQLKPEFDYFGIDTLPEYKKACDIKGIRCRNTSLFDFNDKFDYIFVLGTFHIGFDETLGKAIRRLWSLTNKKLIFTVLDKLPGPHFTAMDKKCVLKIAGNLTSRVSIRDIGSAESMYILERFI